MSGIVAYGSYVPYHRLTRGSLPGKAGALGTRTVAGFDEDTVSMGFEAARRAIAAASPARQGAIQRLMFSTCAPPYLDKTAATTIHAALGLPTDVLAFDVGSAVRSGISALRVALDSPEAALAVVSDIRFGLPASAEEATGGDAAAAFLCGDQDVIAEFRGGASASAEFMERWRVPGAIGPRRWEDHFGEHVYKELFDEAFENGLARGGLKVGELDRLVVTGTHPRAVKQAAAATGVGRDVLVDDLAGVVGNSGAAHPGLLLSSVLDVAGPGERIGLVVLSDGIDCLFLETTDALASRRATIGVSDQLAAGSEPLDYMNYLRWRQLISWEPARRPDIDPPSAPPVFRANAWKYGFVGSRCTECDTRHVPPRRVCIRCGATDAMAPMPMADVGGAVRTMTTDYLAVSVSSPVLNAVIDFDGGGRIECELTDVDKGAVAIGDRITMTLRCSVSASSGIHNYYWKARPDHFGSTPTEG